MATISYGFFDMGGLRDLAAPAGYADDRTTMSDLAAMPGGGFVAAFAYRGDAIRPDGAPDPATDAILIQRYDADGQRVGEPAVIASGAPGWQVLARLATAPDGRVFLTYETATVLYEDVSTIQVASLNADLDVLVAPQTVVFEGGATNGVVPQLAYDPLGDRLHVAAFADFDGDTRVATLDGADLDPIATQTWRGSSWDPTPIGAAVLTDGELVLAGEVTDTGLRVLHVFPYEQMAGFPTPQLFDTPAVLASLPGGGFALGRAIPDQEGDLAVDFYAADARRVASRIVSEGGGAEDVNLAVLPSGHVLTFHRASFGPYGDDLVVANAFGPDGSILFEDVMLSAGLGPYFGVHADVLTNGQVALSWRDMRRGPGGGGAQDLLLLDLVAIHEADGDAGEIFEGDALTDAMFGGLGSDTMRGGAGDDVLEGAGGGDLLFGGEGADVLYGDGGLV